MQTLRRPKVRDQATQKIKQYITREESRVEIRHRSSPAIVDHLAEGRVDAATAE